MNTNWELENKYQTNIELNNYGEEIIWLDEFQRWYSYEELLELKKEIFNTYFKLANLYKDWNTVKEVKGKN